MAAIGCGVSEHLRLCWAFCKNVWLICRRPRKAAFLLLANDLDDARRRELDAMKDCRPGAYAHNMKPATHQWQPNCASSITGPCKRPDGYPVHAGL